MLRMGFCRLALFGGLMAWALASHPGATLAGPAALNDQGTFEISIAGNNIGAERFQIISARDRIVAKAEIELHTKQGGKTLAFHSFPELVLDSQLQPLSYAWSLEGSGSSRLEIDFTTAPAKALYHTVNGKDDHREFLLAKDVIVLDDNVLNQYEILVDRYDKTSRGQQIFRAFIPQEALPGQVKIAETGMEPVSLNGESKSLRHLVVATDLARIDLWADGQGRLWRVSVAAARFNAVRQK
ncbi:MAG TPA: hypothetical protein VMV34_09195 [Terriglobia bacterium]|nr:hypothetical protein [Terriglobia bacterium]